jgi:hypothetical protein
MAFTRTLRLTVMVGMSLASIGENPPVTTPVPAGQFELGTGRLQPANTPYSRNAVLQLLERARKNYALREAGRGYDLKVSFTVNSSGQTLYDGAWSMEEMFVPHRGRRWTATSAAGYTTTQLFVDNHVYGKSTTDSIPLRLHQARAALFGPIASSTYANRDAFRTTTSPLNGVSATCVFLSRPGRGPSVPQGRRWDESEECIDPQSGLLLLHSLAPGTYDVYDYTNAPTLGDYKLPRKITVFEGGKAVVQLEVTSLTELDSPDPGLFAADDDMKRQEQGIVLGEAKKRVIFDKQGPIPPGSLLHPICISGEITPAGRLVEAHSLQPSDPNSEAAIQLAESVDFTTPLPTGAPRQQHLGFVIVRFVSAP